MSELAKQQRKETIKGFITSNNKEGHKSGEGEVEHEGNESDYENSEDEIHTPEVVKKKVM